jgi:WD40 repeat protein
VWDIAGRLETHRLTADHAAAAFDPTDGTLAVAGADGTVRWSAAGAGAADVRLPLGMAGASVAFSPDGLWLAAAADSAVIVFDTRTWERAVVLTGDAETVWFAAEGGWLVTAGDTSIVVREVQSWRSIAVLPVEGRSGFGTSVRVSGDLLGAVTRRTCGRALFDDARVWNVRTGEETAWRWAGCPVERDTGSAGGEAAFLERAADWPLLANPDTSPDGYWHADATDDVLTLSQAGTGRTIAWLRHDARVRAFAFGPGGDLLATTGDDGIVSIWPISARGRDRLVVQVCARVGRTALGDDDWRTFIGDADPRPTCPLRPM